jgi:hypothetical protein
MDLRCIAYLYLFPTKGPTCVLNGFVHKSHDLGFRNNVGFCKVECNTRM